MTANWGESFLALFYAAIALGAYYVGGWEGVSVLSLALLFYISHKVTYEVGRDFTALRHSVESLTKNVESLVEAERRGT